MLSILQGLTEEQFRDLSRKVRTAVAHLGQDIKAHGSRVRGDARADSDLDLQSLSPRNASTNFSVTVSEPRIPEARRNGPCNMPAPQVRYKQGKWDFALSGG